MPPYLIVEPTNVNWKTKKPPARSLWKVRKSSYYVSTTYINCCWDWDEIITALIGSYKFVEKPLEFVKPLKDIEVTEGQDIVLECVVSKEGLKASWQKNGKALPVDNRIKVTADKDTYRLTITSAMVEDKADYTVKVADKSSTAKVFVEGQHSNCTQY